MDEITVHSGAALDAAAMMLTDKAADLQRVAAERFARSGAADAAFYYGLARKKKLQADAVRIIADEAWGA